ncbi:MAG: hypothetical protein ACF8AM_02395 [Rhodopirellula sp. JB055]|uniref:hypothetical protein n=1 Tax=Rhodopirellula sp. JB055 TaxID=3342846 RepID=UPI00370CC034
MNHWIDAGADAEIDEDQHLVSCPHCQQTLTIWRQLEMGVRTPEGGWNASSVKPSFARKAARWSVTLAACFFAVIVLRPPGNQLPVDQADSGVGSTSDGVQWKGAAPISNSSGFSGNGSLASDLSNEGSGLARENDSAEAFLAADDVAVEAASDESILLARWIAQSRPTVAQLSVGVAPLGRTLQRTANLFY